MYYNPQYYKRELTVYTLGLRFSHEILDLILDYIPHISAYFSHYAAKRKMIEPIIEEISLLQGGVDELHAVVSERNRHVWPTLLATAR